MVSSAAATHQYVMYSKTYVHCDSRVYTYTLSWSFSSAGTFLDLFVLQTNWNNLNVVLYTRNLNNDTKYCTISIESYFEIFDHKKDTSLVTRLQEQIRHLLEEA